MKIRNILISGAGVAGPSLAYWLARFGYHPTIVERAPALRDGGQAVDFRGAAHLSVLERMGILGEIRRRQSRGGEVSFVDDHGTPLATMSPEMASGDVEILRGDLGHVLFEATENVAEYIFGDSICAIDQAADGVHVTFERGQSRVFDLVVGADGLHSAVRALVFGPESQYIHYSGYYVAISSAANEFGVDNRGLLYSVPGRTAGVFTGGGTSRTIFYFASPPLRYDRHDSDVQKQIVSDVFDGMSWETPRLIEQMWQARDFYFDSISEIRMPALSNGRVVLLGDAGYGGTIGGMGTGVAVVCAYVLAGEIAAADGDYTAAFGRYAERIGTYAERCQRGARSVGSFMAPRTRPRIWLRNRMLKAMYMLPGKGAMEKIAMNRASAITFGDYPI